MFITIQVAHWHASLIVFQDSVAERSKALASGASPKGRGFESHRC